MNWIELVKQRLWTAISRLPFSDARKEAVLDEELSKLVLDTELGRAFGESPREGDPDYTMPSPISNDEDAPPADPVTSRGEKLSKLRAEAHRWGGWEPWT